MEANALIEKKKRAEIFPPSFFLFHLPFAGAFVLALTGFTAFFVLTAPFLPFTEGLGGEGLTALLGAGELTISSEVEESAMPLGAGPGSRTESSLTIIFQNN